MLITYTVGAAGCCVPINLQQGDKTDEKPKIIKKIKEQKELQENSKPNAPTKSSAKTNERRIQNLTK